MTPYVLEKSVESGIGGRLFSAAEIHRLLEFFEGTRRRGLNGLREVISALPVGSELGDSDGEGRFIKICRSRGIEVGAQRVHLDVDGKDLFPDFSYLAELIFVEHDGGVHSRTSVRRRDREKITLYASAGLVPVIFTDDDSDAYIAEHLTKTLRERRELARQGRLPAARARILSAHQPPDPALFAPHPALQR